MMILRLPLLIAAFITAMLTGFKLGEHIDPWDRIFYHRVDPISQPSVDIPENNQLNLLIINIDDMNKQDAHLKGIWLAAKAENSSKITFVPIYPSTEDPDLNTKLSESFNLDMRRPSKEFWRVLKTTNIWWKGYLVTDFQSNSKIFDSLGGDGAYQQHLNDERAVKSYSSWRDDAVITLQQQKLLIERICFQIGENQSSNLRSVIDIIKKDLVTDKRTTNLGTEWSSSVLLKDKLDCTFPTFKQIPYNTINIKP